MKIINWRNQHKRIGFFGRVKNYILNALVNVLVRVILFSKWLLKWTVITGTFGIVVYIAFLIGSFYNPAVKYVQAESNIPPILHRIAMAESLNSQLCTQKQVTAKMCKKGALGTVLINATLDVGKYQINAPANGAWCLQKGYDIFQESDNEKCAVALFNERGSEPWSSSKSNWNK